MIRARRGPTRGGRSGGSNRSIRHVPGSGGGGSKSSGGGGSKSSGCAVVILLGLTLSSFAADFLRVIA